MILQIPSTGAGREALFNLIAGDINAADEGLRQFIRNDANIVGALILAAASGNGAVHDFLAQHINFGLQLRSAVQVLGSDTQFGASTREALLNFIFVFVYYKVVENGVGAAPLFCSIPGG